jgi:hypothetical protein
MWFKKSQYINLKDTPASVADDAEKKYRLFSPLVQLSGSSRGRSRKLSRGIFIQKGSDSERSPLIDLTAIFRALVYGISFLVFTIGNIFKNPRSGGQFNGGQA